MRKRFVIPILLIVLVALGWFYDRQPSNSTPPSSAATTQPKASFNKSQYSLTDATSPWVVVNKKRPLNPDNYVPANLVNPNVALRLAAENESMKVTKDTATGLERLFAAAKQNGTPLRVSSGYRSYAYQVSLYNHYVQTEGQSAADSESARPGYSEHQTGLAADVGQLNGKCNVELCFGTTAAGQWLAANAYKYGFIIRYPDGLTAITGYEYEPWHVRYVGVALATEMHQQQVLTLEQFFGLEAAADY